MSCWKEYYESHLMSGEEVVKLIESGELPAHKKGRSWRISAAAVTERASK